MERSAFMPAAPQVNKGIQASSSPLSKAPPAMQMSSPMEGSWSPDQQVEILYDPLKQPEQPQRPNGGSYGTLGWLSILAVATGGALMAGRNRSGSASQSGSQAESALKCRHGQLVTMSADATATDDVVLETVAANSPALMADSSNPEGVDPSPPVNWNSKDDIKNVIIYAGKINASVKQQQSAQ
jgi:hypothetical protein